LRGFVDALAAGDPLQALLERLRLGGRREERGRRARRLAIAARARFTSISCPASATSEG